MEAKSRGYNEISELSNEVILSLCPSPATLGRALELAQHVLDEEQASDFDAARALAVFLIHDAGHKKKES